MIIIVLQGGTMKHKKILITGLVLTTFLLTGCGAPKLKNGEELVAEVKGYEVSIDELYKTMKNRFARDVLIQMIDEYILNEEYKDEDFADATQAEVDSIKQQTGTNFLETIKQQIGVNNEQELYDYIMIYLKRQEATKDYAATIVTDAEVKNYYDNQYMAEYKSSHILIKSDAASDASTEEKTAAEAKALKAAKDIITKLNKGEDFATLAKKYSDDEGSKTTGGDLGYMTDNQLVEEYEAAIRTLKVGEYTKEPVKSTFGYHIIKLVKEKDKLSLAKATDYIKGVLAADKVSTDTTLATKAIESLRKEYGFKIYDSSLKSQYNEYMEYLKNSSTQQ